MASIIGVMWDNAVAGILILLFSYFAFQWVKRKETGPNLERLRFFDFLKGISMLAIVAIHASDKVPGTAWIKDWLWFALPIFVLVSGYLLALRHAESAGRGYFSNVFWRVGLPYLIFVLGYTIAWSL